MEGREPEGAQALAGLPQRWHVTALDLGALRFTVRRSLQNRHSPANPKKNGVTLKFW